MKDLSIGLISRKVVYCAKELDVQTTSVCLVTEKKTRRCLLKHPFRVSLVSYEATISSSKLELRKRQCLLGMIGL